MKIHEVLFALPHGKGIVREDNQWTNGSMYQAYNEIGTILNPLSIVGIGVDFGHSLIALIDGASRVREIVWFDDESLIPNSNQMCLNNIRYYFEHLSKVSKQVDVQYSYSKNLLLNAISEGKKYDLIHIRGDSSYNSTFDNLNIAYHLSPKVILVDGYLRYEEVRHAASVLASLYCFRYAVFPKHDGIAIIDRTPQCSIISKLVESNVQIDFVEPFQEMINRKTCWCGGTLSEQSVHPLYNHCDNCGTFVYPGTVSEEGIKKLYKCSDYWYTHVQAMGFPTLEERGEYILKQRVPRWYDLVLRYAKKIDPLLEIGCAEGSFLWYCKDKGIPSVVGVEVDEDTCSFARKKYGLEHVYSGVFPHVSLPYTKYNVICAFDVLEHFADPLLSLRAMKNLLGDGGILIIQTPIYRGEGATWLHFKPPEHLYLLTEESARLLFDRAGFDVISVEDGFIREDKIFILQKKVDVDALVIPRRNSTIKESTAEFSIAVGLIEHFGDIVACEPVSRYLRYMYPSAYIVWCVRKEYVEILRNNPYLDEVVTVHCLTEWIEIKESGIYNQYVDLHIDRRKCPVCGRELVKDTPFRVTGETYFKVGNLLSAFSKGAGLPALDGVPRVYIDEATVEAVNHLSLPRRFVVFHAMANESDRDWHKAGWAALLAYLKNKYDLPVVEIGVRPVLSQFSDLVVNLCGKTTLLETAEIIRRAALFVGVESGPAHMAYALGTDAVILLGQYRSFQRYIPYSKVEEKSKNFKLVYSRGGPAQNVHIEDVCRAIDDFLQQSTLCVQNSQERELQNPGYCQRTLLDSRYSLDEQSVVLFSQVLSHGNDIESIRYALRIAARKYAHEYHSDKLGNGAEKSTALLVDLVHLLLHYGIVTVDRGNVYKGWQLIYRGLRRAHEEDIWENYCTIDQQFGVRKHLNTYFQDLESTEDFPKEFMYAFSLFLALEQQFDGALQVIEAVQNRDPMDKEAEKIQTLIHRSIERYLRKTAKAGSALLEQAEEYIQNGRFSLAEELLYQILSSCPDNVDALNDLAVIYIAQGKVEKSITVLNKVLVLDPVNEIAIENLQAIFTST
ncbi:MAG: methyltransferase domain-containing protein [Bacteroidetes bacterium]|nr:methyltransferase domain-containing protein [Bacteroidota bacterium]